MWRSIDRLDATAWTIVVLVSSDGIEFVIHAMPMRTKYRKLLEP